MSLPPGLEPVHVLVKYKQINPGQVARKIPVSDVNEKFVAGLVVGLRVAFNEHDYAIDLEEVRAMQKRMADAVAAARSEKVTAEG